MELCDARLDITTEATNVSATRASNFPTLLLRFVDLASARSDGNRRGQTANPMPERPLHSRTRQPCSEVVCALPGMCWKSQREREEDDIRHERPTQRGCVLFIRNKISARSFSDRSFWKPLRVVDVRAFGSWMSAPKCLFFQHFDRPDRSFGPGYPRE